MELRLEILANCIECLKALQHKKISVIINQNIIISTKESNMDVIVIGAGASGLLAAYEASKK